MGTKRIKLLPQTSSQDEMDILVYFNWMTLLIIEKLLVINGRVSIDLEYNPPYMQTGKNLSIKCSSDDSYQLQWYSMTRNSDFSYTLIEPYLGGPYIVRKLYEEPSGYVESMLIKNNITLEDTGTYKCSSEDDASFFAIYVPVLQIVKSEDVRPSSGTERVELECQLTGFTTNIPEIAYVWLFNGLLIPNGHVKYSMTQSENWSKITLLIKDLNNADTGQYTCMFTMSTSFGPSFNASETIRIDAGALTSASCTPQLGILMPVIGLISLLYGVFRNVFT